MRQPILNEHFLGTHTSKEHRAAKLRSQLRAPRHGTEKAGLGGSPQTEIQEPLTGIAKAPSCLGTRRKAFRSLPTVSPPTGDSPVAGGSAVGPQPTRASPGNSSRLLGVRPRTYVFRGDSNALEKASGGTGGQDFGFDPNTIRVPVGLPPNRLHARRDRSQAKSLKAAKGWLPFSKDSSIFSWRPLTC